MRARSVLSIVAIVAIGIILTLGTGAAASGATFEWTPPSPVSAGQPGRSASIVVASDGSITAVWLHDGPVYASVVTATSDNDGASWSTPQTISAAGVSADVPEVAALGGSTLVAVWQRFGGGTTIVASTSLDGGATWTAPYELPAPGIEQYYPDLASDGTRLIVTFSRYLGGTFSGVRAMTTTDGITWSPEVAVAGTAGYSHYSRVSVSGLSATVVWSSDDGTTSTLRTSSSSDGGLTWGPEQGISVPERYVFNPQLVRSADGTLTVVWTGFTGTDWHEYATSSTAGGTWTAPLLLSTETGTPAVTTGPDSSIVISWTASGSNQLSFVRSTDGGVTYSALAPITEVGTTVQIASLIITPSGELVAAAVGTVGADQLVLSHSSTDGGLTWSAPTTLSTSTAPWDPRLAITAGGQPLVLWSGDAVSSSTRRLPAPEALASGGVEPLPWAAAGLTSQYHAITAAISAKHPDARNATWPP